MKEKILSIGVWTNHLGGLLIQVNRTKGYRAHLRFYPSSTGKATEVSPSSIRRVLRAIAKMAGVTLEQPNVFSAFDFWDNPEDAIYDNYDSNRIAQADEAERKARTK
jgi:hypothetical protein